MNQRHKNIFYILTGVVLEYFDVMLYIHLAAAISAGLFLTDLPFMARAGYAFSFLSTVAMRPIGAIIWGHIGDKYGRKVCVSVTPVVVALCCFAITLLPSYREIGITSVILFFLVRAIQGLAWIGEKTAANVYITEVVEFKKAGFYTSLAGASEGVGEMIALALISFFLTFYPEAGWRYPFIIGGLVALFSIPLRRNLEESKEYLESKKRLDNLKEFGEKTLRRVKFQEVLAQYKSVLFKFFVIEMLFGAGFFFVYIFNGEILAKECGLSPANVASHNLGVSLVQTMIILMFGFMSLKWDGLKIVQYRVLIYLFSLPLIFWYYLSGEITEFKIYVTQILICLLGMDHIPCLAHLVKPLPVLVRMRGFAFSYAMGKVLMYIITTFGLAYLALEFGKASILVFFMIVTAAVSWAIWTYPPAQNQG